MPSVFHVALRPPDLDLQLLQLCPGLGLGRFAHPRTAVDRAREGFADLAGNRLGARDGGGRQVARDVFARQHRPGGEVDRRSEEHPSELQSLMRTSYAVFCLKKTKTLT